jgi:beta-aspartyl-dipeptidase (metallo-type)
MKLFKNVELHAPAPLGKGDVLMVNGRIAALSLAGDAPIAVSGVAGLETIECDGLSMAPGFIDQHIHITGAGGKYGYGSMTPEVHVTDLIRCGTTTVVGLLGTDGTARSLNSLYAKCAALEAEGLSAWMLSSYFGFPPKTITGSVHDDLLFIDRVVGCKIALSDVRSSYPTAHQLLALLREIQVGGMISSKGGVLHIHLGALPEGMDLLFELVEKYHVDIKRLSPTHVGRTAHLFEQAQRFTQMGGMVDLSTGGTQFRPPWEALAQAHEDGADLRQFTLSSDGNAGIGILDSEGQLTGFKKAPIDLNLWNVQQLLRGSDVSAELALGLVTSGPARTMGLHRKGNLAQGMDADACLFDSEWNLSGVVSQGEIMMWNGELRAQGNFPKA